MELLFLIAFLSTGVVLYGALYLWEKYLQREEGAIYLPKTASQFLVERFFDEERRVRNEQTRFIIKKEV